MPITLQLVEPQGRPLVASRVVEAGAIASVYLHPDAADASSALRATVLCAPDQHPPRGARLILEVEVGSSGSRLQRVGEGVLVELLRGELRSRVTAGTQLKSPSRLEALFPDQRRIGFTLDTSSQGVVDPRGAVGSGGTRRSAALAANRGALWLVPTAFEMLVDPDGIVLDNLGALGRRFGLSARGVVWITLLWFTVAGAAWAFYNQRLQTTEAREQAEAVEDELQASEAARAVALSAELSCLTERGALVTALGEAAERRRLSAEVALAVSGAQGAAIELGGQRFGAPEVLAADAEQRERLLAEITRGVENLGQEALEVEPCLGHSAVLGADLPLYALLWHPDPTLSCPRTYASVSGGVSLVGRWGLSARVSAEFGAPDPALTLALDQAEGVDRDPRANDRWAVAALVTGLRVVQSTLDRYDGAGRVPVAPSQSQLWSLALWSAYNQMPDPVAGEADATAERCLSLLLDDLAAEAGPAEPGQPLLPDLVAVVTEEVVVPARPIPACPWPADAVRQGASAALTAVTRLAVRSAPPPEPVKNQENP